MVHKNMEVGRFTYGHETIALHRLGARTKMKIGSFCSIAGEVTVLLGGNHRVDWATTFPFGQVSTRKLGGKEIVGHPATNGDVVVGNDVWIGLGATIMSGVTIADGAVIAAGSHVVTDVAPYAIVGGNPAKQIRFRFEQEIRDLLLELRWWELDVDAIREIAPTLCTPPDADTLRGLIGQYRG